ncbi:hypothetical protein Ocin01_17482 [Orchesella cincta]|uniref:Uncharacterized protein n=1 Tax=Orchesella cincta TaxID=48709 RepID=A0A1D2M8A0_ORCCI|nr:hypothetical protein Ocin01_17482 [Orchesella cincta]
MKVFASICLLPTSLCHSGALVNHFREVEKERENQTGPISGVSGCNLLVITFASGSDVGDSTGFVLEYSVLTSSSLSPLSQDYIVNSGVAGIIRHPSSGSRYENYELDTFVILPSLGSNTNVIYFRDTLEANYCYDSLSVYRY